MTRIVPCLTAIALLTLPLRADPLADTFAHIDAAARTFKGMTANLQETVYTALAKDTSVSTGDIKLKRDKSGEIRWLVNFTQPDQKMAALDGSQAKIYYPKTNIEQIYDISTKRDLVEQVMLLGFGATSAELKAHYDISFLGAESLGGQSTAHLKLIPKSPDMLKNFRQVELWISDSLGVPVQQKFLTSSNGDFEQFAYSSLKLNASLSDKDLQLKTAKGVQIKKIGS